MRLNAVQELAVNLIDIACPSACAECLLVWEFTYKMTALTLGLSVYLNAWYFDIISFESLHVLNLTFLLTICCCVAKLKHLKMTVRYPDYNYR
jgi:hypothetical protein